MVKPGNWEDERHDLAEALGVKAGDMHTACCLGLADQVAELVKEDPANVHSLDARRMQPLNEAVYYGYPDIARFLIDHGADLDWADVDGDTPLLEAARQGQIETAEMLLQHGADASIANRAGWTAAHLAVQTRNLQILKLLCEHKADLSAAISKQPYNGCTPLHIAADNLDPATAKYLLEHGAPADARDAKGRTALHWSAAYGDTATGEVLVNAGADANAADRHGYTPLDYAVKDKHIAVAALLRNHGGKEAADPKPGAYPEEDMHVCAALGLDDRYLLVPGSPSLSPAGSFTAELWINAWALPSAKVALLTRDDEKLGPYQLVLDPDGTLEAGAAGMTWMKVPAGASNAPLPLNQWVHLALECDGKKVRVYADGAMVADYDAYGSLSGTDNPLSVCRPLDRGTCFPGMVREVRVSKSVRYTDDFTPTWRFEPDADTVLLLHVDEAKDAMLRDSSGKRNNGIFAQGLWWWMLP